MNLGMLKRNLSKCSLAAKEIAYRGMCKHILEYTSAVWDPYQKNDKHKLERIQKKQQSFTQITINMKRINDDNNDHTKMKDVEGKEERKQTQVSL